MYAHIKFIIILAAGKHASTSLTMELRKYIDTFDLFIQKIKSRLAAGDIYL